MTVDARSIRHLVLVISVESNVVPSNDAIRKKSKKKEWKRARRDSRGMAGDKVECLGVLPG